jgi:hypothetical protein
MASLIFPESPSPGQIFDNWEWDGTKWVAGPSSFPPPAIIDNAPPTNPVTGDLWWDDVGGQLYVYYNDGTTTQWVLANVSPIGPAGAAGPAGATGPAGPNTLPPGVTNGVAAAAGQIGEVYFNSNTNAPFTTATAFSGNVGTLTAGDWEGWVTGFALMAAGTAGIDASILQSNNTAQIGYGLSNAAFTESSGNIACSFFVPFRILQSASGSVTVSGTSYPSTANNGPSGNGTYFATVMYARRMR